MAYRHQCALSEMIQFTRYIIILLPHPIAICLLLSTALLGTQ